MAMQESGEMYLETIYLLSKKNNLVRSIEIAEYMGVSKPAVSRAVAKLKEGRYIIVDNDGYIALTENGRQIADSMYQRHTCLTNCLIRLGVDRETAEKDACRIEHDISDSTFEAIKKHAEAHS